MTTPPSPIKLVEDTNTNPVIVDDAAVVEDTTGVDPQLNEVFEEWYKVQHFEEWDQFQHLKGGDANAQATMQEPVVVMAVEALTVGTAKPGTGHEAVVEQPLSSAGRPTHVRTVKNKYIPSHTGKGYGYAICMGNWPVSRYNTWRKN